MSSNPLPSRIKTFREGEKRATPNLRHGLLYFIKSLLRIKKGICACMCCVQKRERKKKECRRKYNCHFKMKTDSKAICPFLSVGISALSEARNIIGESA